MQFIVHKSSFFATRPKPHLYQNNNTLTQHFILESRVCRQIMDWTRQKDMLLIVDKIYRSLYKYVDKLQIVVHK